MCIMTSYTFYLCVDRGGRGAWNPVKQQQLGVGSSIPRPDRFTTIGDQGQVRHMPTDKIVHRHPSRTRYRHRRDLRSGSSSEIQKHTGIIVWSNPRIRDLPTAAKTKTRRARRAPRVVERSLLDHRARHDLDTVDYGRTLGARSKQQGIL